MTREAVWPDRRDDGSCRLRAPAGGSPARSL